MRNIVDEHGGKHSNFSRWQAYFGVLDPDFGMRTGVIRRPHCRSTKITKRKEAQKVADLWEAVAQKKKSAQQLRSVFSGLLKEAYGQEIQAFTARDFCAKWLEEKTHETSKSTLLGYRTTVNDFCAFLGQRADLDITALIRSDVVAWRRSLSIRLYPSTVNRHLKILRMIFKAAQRDQVILDNPADSVERTKSVQVEPAGRRPFTIPEIQVLLGAADLEWQSLIKFGLYSGQRLTDLSLLTWNNINLEQDVIRFTAQKTGKKMEVPIAGPLKTHLLSLASSEDPNAPLHPRAYETICRQGYVSTVSRWFGELLGAAGLRSPSDHQSRGTGRSERRKREELSFHSLRHSTTTILHEAGIPASVAQALIGHDSEAMHEQYVSVGREALRKAAAALPEL